MRQTNMSDPLIIFQFFKFVSICVSSFSDGCDVTLKLHESRENNLAAVHATHAAVALMRAAEAVS